MVDDEELLELVEMELENYYHSMIMMVIILLYSGSALGALNGEANG